MLKSLSCIKLHNYHQNVSFYICHTYNQFFIEARNRGHEGRGGGFIQLASPQVAPVAMVLFLWRQGRRGTNNTHPIPILHNTAHFITMMIMVAPTVPTKKYDCNTSSATIALTITFSASMWFGQICCFLWIWHCSIMTILWCGVHDDMTRRAGNYSQWQSECTQKNPQSTKVTQKILNNSLPIWH